jgi:nucleoside-diphosphate-sugar epimerase
LNVLIAGAGDLGSRVCRQLRGLSVNVTAFSRSGHDGFLAADLYDSAAMQELAAKHDVLIFCAAPSARDEVSYRKLYIESLAPFLAANLRIIFCASTAVYDVDNGDWCDERRAINFNQLAFNGRVLREAELGLRNTDLSLRLGGIYGPGRDYALRQVRAGAPAQANHWTNRVHIEDAASATIHLLKSGAKGCINLVDNEPCTQSDQYAFLRTLYGLGSVPDLINASSGKRVSNTLLRASGFEFRYPSYREGYAALKI